MHPFYPQVADSVSPATMIGRVARVLSGFVESSTDEQRITDIARRSGLPKATVSRIVAELIDQNLLERSGSAVRLGIRFFELGQRAARPQELRRLSVTRMLDLRNTTRRTVHLAVLDGAEVVYVAILHGKDPPPMASRIGGRLPAHATAVGKALLAFAAPQVVDGLLATELQRLSPHTLTDRDVIRAQLSAIRGNGMAYEREESGLGVACVAAPIRIDEGTAIAALSVSARTDEVASPGLAHALRTAAYALGKEASRNPVFRTV